jgi:hypothetical protein
VSFAVAVNAPGSGTPSGIVTVTDGAGATCSAAVALGSCALASTTAGAKTLTATYGGDGNFNGSTSAGEPHQVDKASTTTTITADTPDPSVVGQPYTVSFLVGVNAPGSGTPTGTVTVSDGTGATCSAAVAAGSCALTSTTAGAKTLTATYAGDGNFNGSAGTAAHQVDKASTASGVASNTNPSTFGQAVTFTATVTSTGGTPTGTVTFKDGATTLGTGTLNGAGQATFTTAALAAGSHSITAAYAGDANFIGSTSPALTQVVNAPTTLGLIVNPNWVRYAYLGPVSFIATLTRDDTSGGVPGATVTFSVDGTAVGTAITDSAGNATFYYNPSALTPGTHSVQATFATVSIGGVTFDSSTAAQLLNVTAPTTLGLTLASTSSTVTFTATLTRNDTNQGVGAAAVSFLVDGVSVGSTVTNGSGVTTLTIPKPGGSHTAQATFAGQTIGGILFLNSASATIRFK